MILSRHLLAALMAVAAFGDTRSPPPLTHYAPASTGLYVEVNDSADLLLALSAPELWSALAELAGQPADAPDAAGWRRELERTLGMSINEVAHRLVSGSVALIGEGPLRTQDPVVICRPAREINFDALLRSVQRDAMPDSPNILKLTPTIGATASSDAMAFGDPRRADGMFRVIAKRLHGEGDADPLSLDPALQRLLGRARPGLSGFAFARLSDARPPLTTQPVAERTVVPRLPAPLRGASTALLTLHRDGRRLHLSLLGDGSGALEAPPGELLSLVQRLPDDTLAAWGGHVDYAALRSTATRIPEANLTRILISPQDPVLARLAAELRSAICIAIGAVERSGPQPPTPAAAVLLRMRDVDAASETLDVLLRTWVSLYNLLALQRGLPTLERPEPLQVAGLTAQRVDLAPVLKRFAPAGLERVELCWMAHEDAFIIATDREWLERVLQSRMGRARGLAGVLRTTDEPIAANSESIAVAQTRAIGTLGAAWLDFLEAQAPAVLSESFWRARQPRQPQLGIRVTQSAERRALVVTQVDLNGPADRLLEVGDRIVGCEGRLFAQEQPVREVRQALLDRAASRWFDVIIERGGDQFTVRLPLPFVDPIAVLRRWVAVGRVVESVVYADDAARADGPCAAITVNLQPAAVELADQLRPRPATAGAQSDQD